MVGMQCASVFAPGGDIYRPYIWWKALNPLPLSKRFNRWRGNITFPSITFQKKRLIKKTRCANHQGVLLQVGRYPYAQLGDALAAARAANEEPLLLLLDHLEDPQNVGTLIRTAEAMRVHGIITPSRRAVGVTPAVSNASAGAVEHMVLIQVANLVQLIQTLKSDNVWIAGLDRGKDAQPFSQARLDGGLGIVLGAEGAGLSRLVRESCDFIIELPQYGQVASLNAAVAGSVVVVAARTARSNS